MPTGKTVTVLRGRSQHQNRDVALAELTRRLERSAAAETTTDRERRRRAQVAAGAGHAASSLARDPVLEAKAWTYNDQRDEVVHHATGRVWRMSRFLRGHIA